MSEPIDSHPSLTSAVESIDEVHLSLGAQPDDESTGDDQTSDQSDHALIVASSVEPDSRQSNGQLSDQVQPEEVLEALDEAIAAGSVDTSSAPSPPGTIQVDIIVSNSTNAVVDGPVLVPSAVTPNQGPVPSPENEGAHPAVSLEAPLLEEHDLTVLAQKDSTEGEIEILHASQEIDQVIIPGEPGHLDQQTIELSLPGTPTDPPGYGMENIPGVETVHRTDNETISVTDYNRDNSIGILHDISAPKDAAATELAPVEETSQVAVSPPNDPQEDAPVSVAESLDDIQEVDPNTGIEEVPGNEDVSMGMNNDPAVDGNTDDVEMDELASTIIEEHAPVTDVDPNITVEMDTVSSINPVITVAEQFTVTVQHTAKAITGREDPQSEADIQPQAGPGPEITITDTETTTATVAASVELIPKDSPASMQNVEDIDAQQLERAAQIRQEQDATVDPAVSENCDTPRAQDHSATPIPLNEDDLPTTEPTLSKNSEELLLTLPETELQATETGPLAEPAGPTELLVTQAEDPVASEPPSRAEPSYDQHQIAAGEQPAQNSLERPTPEWEEFASEAEALEKPGSSAGSSRHLGSAIDNPITNHARNSAGEAPEATPALGGPANTTTTRGPQQKRRMIMEVVIPLPSHKYLRQARPAPASSGTEASLPSEDETDANLPKSSTHLRQRKPNQRPFGNKKQTSKSAGKKRAPTVHAARPLKVEVVVSKASKPKPRTSLLRRTGSIASGNNVKFATVSPVIGKRKVEDRPDDVPTEGEDSDADAEGEEEEEDSDAYEDVEQVKAESKSKTAKPRVKRTRASSAKRPHRSIEARKPPSKLPEVLTGGSRSPAAKKRRLRR